MLTFIFGFNGAIPSPRFGNVALHNQPTRVGRPQSPSRPSHYANFLEPDIHTTHDQPLAMIFKDHAQHRLSEPDFFLRVLALRKSFSETGDLKESHRLISGILETDDSSDAPSSPQSPTSAYSDLGSPIASDQSASMQSSRSNSFDLGCDESYGNIEFGDDNVSSPSPHSFSDSRSPCSPSLIAGNTRPFDFDSGVLTHNLLRDRDRRLSSIRDAKVERALRPSIPSGTARGTNSASDYGYGGRLTSEEAGI